MRIGELAKNSGMSVEALRFYERKGLLPEPSRTDSGYRTYSKQHVERLAFIKQAKALGFSLSEIVEVLALRGNNKAPCSEVVAIAKRHLTVVEAELERLGNYRSELKRALREWESRKGKPCGGSICSLIENTIRS